MFSKFPSLKEVPTTIHLTRPNSRSWRRIRSRNRIIDVKLNARVARLISTREADQRARSAVATVLDLDLRARDVELRTSTARRTVQADVLNAEQVLACGKGLGECEGDLLFAWIRSLE